MSVTVRALARIGEDSNSSRRDDAGVSVGEWLDVVAACFAAKGTPRAYFERHVVCDPAFDQRQIVVAQKGDCVVSTCRVFERVLSLGGTRLRAGGVGEVCTLPKERGQGLASRVLQEALPHMRDMLGLDIAFLHTSRPQLQTYYAKHGFVSASMAFETFTLSRQSADVLGARHDSRSVIVAALHSSPEEDSDATLEDTEAQLRALFRRQATSDQYDRSLAARFNGPVTRDRKYWDTWITAECCRRKGMSTIFFADGGYAMIQRSPTTAEYHVHEFVAHTAPWMQLEAAVQAAATQHCSETSTTEYAWQVRMPAALVPADPIPQDVRVVNRAGDVDRGWMFRVLNPRAAAVAACDSGHPHTREQHGLTSEAFVLALQRRAAVEEAPGEQGCGESSAENPGRQPCHHEKETDDGMGSLNGFLFLNLDGF